MKATMLLLLAALLFSSCNSKSDEIEFTGNPFEEDFVGDIIEICDEQTSTMNLNHCLYIAKFKFLPSVYNTLRNVSEETDGQLVSLYITIDGEQTAILDSNASKPEGTGAVYDPGFSKFHLYEAEEIFNLFSSITIQENQEHQLEVIFLQRNHPNANAANRKEVVKQIEYFTCEG